MKTNYNFPYQFVDLSINGDRYVFTKLAEEKATISFDLGEFEWNENIDIVFEIENTQTFFRKLYTISNNTTQIEIKYDVLGLKAKYSLLLVSNKDGEIEINGENDYYEKGDCLGILEKDTITIENEKGFSGLVKIGPTEKDIITYDLTSDWITIELPKKTYEKFYPWQKNESTIPIALASLGNGCIQFAILQALNQPQFQDYKWWETLSKLLENKGYNVDDLDSNDIPGATNKILGNCIQGMMDALDPDADQKDTSILA